MCCDYELPLEEEDEEQEKRIEKENKLKQCIEFGKAEEKPIPA